MKVLVVQAIIARIVFCFFTFGEFMKYLGFALILGGLLVAVFSELAIASQGPFRGCIDDFMEQ
jgi:hypothetical protein